MDKTNLLEHSLVGNKPAKNVVILKSDGTIANPSTSEKQDSIIAELEKKTEPGDIQMGELIPMLRSILIAIANPSYIDKSANQLRSQITGTLTTVTTVTTVTNLTNFGSFPADHLQRMDNMTAWQTGVRRLIT